MSMKESMDKWAKKKLDINSELIKRTCQKIGVTGAELDECLMLTSEFDQDTITETQFLVGLSQLCKRPPDEVFDLIRGEKQPQIVIEETKGVDKDVPYTIITDQPAKRYEYRTWLGESLDNKLWELVTRDENPDKPTDSPFYIIIQSIAATSHNRYLPVNPNDPAWSQILPELEKQTRR